MKELKKKIKEILESNTSTVYVGQDSFPVEVIHASNLKRVVDAITDSIKEEIEQRERKAQISESNLELAVKSFK